MISEKPNKVLSFPVWFPLYVLAGLFLLPKMMVNFVQYRRFSVFGKFADFEETHSREYFETYIADLPAPEMLEIGTLRSLKNRPTHQKDRYQHASRYIRTDAFEGTDVDIVSDVHQLTHTFEATSFDAVIAISAFEHFKYPQLAAHEIMKVLRIGGVAFISTPQTFKLHGYPSDYYRFSTRALESLFPVEMGCEVIDSSYHTPCAILNTKIPMSSLCEAYLDTHIVIKKLRETPDMWAYDFSHDHN